MKTRRNLYFILGVLALFFYIGGIYMFLTVIERDTPEGIQSFNYGLFSQQLWLIISVLFFRASYRLHKKINQKKRQELENAFAD